MAYYELAEQNALYARQIMDLEAALAKLKADHAAVIYQRDAITNLLEEECAENTKLRNEITRLRGEL